MFRTLARYEMSPGNMEKWLAALPELVSAIASTKEEAVIEDMWVTKDRTQFFILRTLASDGANRRFVDELLASSWGKKYAKLMKDHVHTTYKIESILPHVVGRASEKPRSATKRSVKS